MAKRKGHSEALGPVGKPVSLKQRGSARVWDKTPTGSYEVKSLL